MSKTLELPKGTLITPAKPHILIGLTAYRTIEQRTTQSLFNAMGHLEFPFGMITHTSANVWKGRNQIVEHFLETDADFLFFVDADMVFTADDMGTMIQAAIDNPQAGVISGFYVCRDQSLRPLIGWTDDDGILIPQAEANTKMLEARGQMVEANMLPTGFMIIRRSVFETLKKPWFIVKTVEDEKTGEIRHYSSDNVFVQNCYKAGIKTYGHFGVELGHVGSFVYHPAQMWPQLEAWSAGAELQRTKLQLGENFGWNSKEYWDALYSVEKTVGRERHYPALHTAIVAGMQEEWSVLDVGSGPGVLAQQISKAGCDVRCLDLSDTAVGYCREAGLEADQWDLVNDPVDTGDHGRYDCVVCTEVLEHLEDPAAAIKKLYSFLKPGGNIYVSVPDNRLPPEEEPEHVQVFTAAKFASLLKPFNEVFCEPIAGYLIGAGKKPSKD